MATLGPMTGDPSSRLARLTARWRERHEAWRAAAVRADALPPADAEREERARTAFPWQTQTPAEYASAHGAAMVGYTYDAYRYSDAALEAWLRELGDLLRERR